MTKEQKARIARENGAKSQGPKTSEGKANSRTNALKHGRRAASLRHLAQPHPAILCNEDRKAFFRLFNGLIGFYRPLSQVALDVVREIAVARWETTRLQTAKSAYFNRALVIESHKDHNLPDELVPVECVLNATAALLQTSAQLDRAIDRLHTRIARLEHRLRYLDTQFPALGTEVLTCPEIAETLADEAPKPTSERTNEQTNGQTGHPAAAHPSLITDDPSAATRDAYRLFFPGRELLVIEPDSGPVDPD